MNILLCSKNESVLKRWRGGLQDEHRTFEADTLETAYRIIGKNEVGLTLLHRIMINEEQIRDMISVKKGNRVFVLSDRPNNDEGISCLQIGCVGYANAYIAQPRLKLAVQAVQSGLIWTGTSLMQHMIQASTAGREKSVSGDNPGTVGALGSLSKREYQVAALVAEGLHNREVAERLDITERTVKAHLSSAYAKTAAKSRLGLARLFAAGQ